MTSTVPTPTAQATLPDGVTLVAPNVFWLLSEVQADLDGIAKDRRVTEGPARFLFRGVDDVMNALHPLLSRHRVLVLPQVQDRIPETRVSNGGKPINVVHLRVRFTFVAPDGSSTYAEAWGEGQDSGDKATGKAHSMAYKSAMLQVFSIPTEPGTSVDDADTDQGTQAAPETDAQRALRERRAQESQAPRQDAQAPQEQPNAPQPLPAHLHALQGLLADLAPDQQAWVRANWGDRPPLARMTVAQAAATSEWLATVPPPQTAAAPA